MPLSSGRNWHPDAGFEPATSSSHDLLVTPSRSGIVGTAFSGQLANPQLAVGEPFPRYPDASLVYRLNFALWWSRSLRNRSAQFSRMRSSLLNSMARDSKSLSTALRDRMISRLRFSSRYA